ncbi:MAG TPA: hypothetical protein PKE26_15760, partial [Kiritimatiellia bacterium]|nr:hypothetical protein [Kiritimatiellia bacterium]
MLAAGGTGADSSDNPGPGGTVAASIGTVRFAGGSGGARGGTGGGGGGGGGSAFATSNGLAGAAGTASAGGAGGAGTGFGGNGGDPNNPGLNGNAPGGGGGGNGNGSGVSGTGAVGRVVITYQNPVPIVPEVIVFSSPELTVVTGKASSLITISLQNTNNQAATATNNITINLSSTLSGLFRNTNDTATITSVVISNGQSSVSFRYIPLALGTHELTASDAALILSSATQTLNAVAGSTIVSTYYVPLDEGGIYNFFTRINSATQGTNTTIIGISVFASNTVIYLDHWEDGYERDVTNPTQATTRVWGDGNAANGCPPGVVPCTDANDILQRGQFIAAITNIPSNPRNPANIFIDGRDKISVTRPIALTRSAFDTGPGGLMADATDVFDTKDWGTRYRFPVGTNLLTGFSSFEVVVASVMALTNNTTVVFDYNNNGVPNQTVVLQEGQVFNLTNNVLVGGSVTSSAPIQLTMMTGDANSTYEVRWYTIPPVNTWSTEYYNPVASTRSDGLANVGLFNPHTNSINVVVEFSDGEEVFTQIRTVPPGGYSIQTNSLLNTAQRYFTTNGQSFLGVGIVDQSGSPQLYDWGFSLVPRQLLTPVFLVGWAPGITPGQTPDGTNRHPVWVTSDRSTTLYVDWKGDGGAFTNDCGEYDVAVPLALLQSVRLFDPSLDNSGMKVFTCDGALLTAAWGQDPSRSFSGDARGFDGGYTVLPLPIIQADKQVAFAPGGDLNSDGFLNPGERIRYTIIVTNPNLSVSGGVTVQDVMPEEILYVTNSTRLDGVLVIADSGVTPFPLDEGGFFLGVLEPQSARIITFDGVVTNPYLSANNVVTNRATVFDDISTIVIAVQAVSTIFEPSLVIDKVSDVTTFVTNNQLINYTITVVNTGTVQITDVTVTDAVPPSVSFVPGTVFVTAPVETGNIVSNNVRDDFNSAAYNLNTGSQNWLGNWVEANDIGTAQSPSAGSVQIVNGRLRITNTNGSLPSIYRQVNLSNTLSAVLSYRYEASNNLEVIDSFVVEISTNSGAAYSVLTNFTGFSGSRSGTNFHDILQFATTNTRVRFRVNSGYSGADEFFRVDWVQVQYTTGTSVRVTNTFAGTPPPVLHSGQTLLGGESMTITFQARATNNLAGIANITNTACVSALGEPGGCDSVIDPVVLDAGLTLVKTVSKGSPGPYPGSNLEIGTNGTPVTYWFLVSNTGIVPLVNVTLNDPDLAFNNVIGTLAAGQSVTVSVNDVISGPLTNIATVTGQYLGNTYTNSDDAVVLTIEPDITIQKTVSASGTFPGGESVTGTNNQPVTYFLVVSNSGNVALTNVVVVDNDVTPTFSTNIGTLTVGQVVTLSLERVISGNLENTATATGEDEFGGPHSDSDDAEVIMISPDISIEKTVSADGTFANSGELVNGTNNQPVTYFFVVSNIGDVSLTNVVVNDPDIPFNSAIGTLAAGQSVTVSVNDVISGSLTNIASVTGEDPLGNPHDDSDDAEVRVFNPSITIEKTVSADGSFASSGELVTGTNNQPVTYFFVVWNNGDVTLTNVVVNDPDIPFNTSIGTLVAGQSVTVSVGSAISGALTNTATATGYDPAGDQHDDSDTAEVALISPDIAIEKTVSADGTFASGVELVTGTNNQPVTYFFVVSNVGDVALTNVVVNDPDIPFNSSIGTLAVGQSVTVSVNDVISGNLTNTATATGEDPLGNPHDDDDTAEVRIIAPSIALTKLVDGVNLVTGTNGQPVVYSFIVLNDGDVALTNVTLIDIDITPAFTNVIGDLAAGQSVTVEVTSVISGNLINTANVSGEDELGNTHTDSDDAEVRIIAPSIALTKLVDGVNLVTGTNGQPVVYSFIVLNDGDVTLTNVTLIDTDITPAFTNVIGTLAAGQSVTVEVASVISGNLINTANVSGEDELGNTHTDSDDAEVRIIAPSIALTKLVDGVNLVTGTNGQPVVYSFIVLNDGDVALTNVTLIDTDITPAFTNVIGDLAAGQSVTVEVASVISGNLINTANVSGEDELGNTHTDSDDAEVRIIAPSIALTKLVDGVNLVTGTNGQPVVYSFIVLNDGDVALTNVTLIDTDITPAFTNVIGTLAAGQSVTIEVASVISGNLINTANVSGEDEL